MRRPAILFFALITLWCATLAQAQESVTLVAEDGVEVYGDYYSSGDNTRPLILLFHQAASNRGEYAAIAPRLLEAGFDSLAIDQRSGATRWGRNNETVLKLGHSTDYLPALADLEAALQWAKESGRSGPLLVWGSSYSAALVFLLAAEHADEIAGLLAFSPGEYLGSADLVRSAAEKVNMPVFITSAQDAREIATAKDILDSVASTDKIQFIPQAGGVHGSSTLLDSANPEGAAENWEAVLKFLKQHS